MNAGQLFISMMHGVTQSVTPAAAPAIFSLPEGQQTLGGEFADLLSSMQTAAGRIETQQPVCSIELTTVDDVAIETLPAITPQNVEMYAAAQLAIAMQQQDRMPELRPQQSQLRAFDMVQNVPQHAAVISQTAVVDTVETAEEFTRSFQQDTTIQSDTFPKVAQTVISDATLPVVDKKMYEVNLMQSQQQLFDKVQNVPQAMVVTQMSSVATTETPVKSVASFQKDATSESGMSTITPQVTVPKQALPVIDRKVLEVGRLEQHTRFFDKVQNVPQSVAPQQATAAATVESAVTSTQPGTATQSETFPTTARSLTSQTAMKAFDSTVIQHSFVRTQEGPASKELSPAQDAGLQGMNNVGIIQTGDLFLKNGATDISLSEIYMRPANVVSLESARTPVGSFVTQEIPLRNNPGTNIGETESVTEREIMTPTVHGLPPVRNAAVNDVASVPQPAAIHQLRESLNLQPPLEVRAGNAAARPEQAVVREIITVSETLSAATQLTSAQNGSPDSERREQEYTDQGLDSQMFASQGHIQPKALHQTAAAATEFNPEAGKKDVQEQVAQQVRERLTQHEMKPGNHQITLTLSPENLGELKMNLSLHGQKLSVEIVAENRTVRDAIMQHTDALKESLSRQNITMESFDVTTGGKGSGNMGQNHNAWRELAKQQQHQQFWSSTGVYGNPQADVLPTLSVYKPKTEHAMLDIHY